jgi:hypothetical protein
MTIKFVVIANGGRIMNERMGKIGNGRVTNGRKEASFAGSALSIKGSEFKWLATYCS